VQEASTLRIYRNRSFILSDVHSTVDRNGSFFGKSRLFLNLTLFVIFALGLAIRLYDLTDPPLDFHSTRQLRSAIIARGLYYANLASAPDWQRERAEGQLESHNLIEPPVFESAAALVYRVIGTDDVWLARILASIFWLIGGAALYFLARDMTSPDGGVIATAFYMFVPFGVIASRSFQPDPLMVMFILLALWAIFRWYQQPRWNAAILAGILAGIALFVKAVALFFILVPIAVLLLVGKGFKKSLKDPHVWVIGTLSVLPMLAYHFYGVYILGSLESQFEGRFFPEMWTDPTFYARWIGIASSFVGYGSLLGAFLGLLLFISPSRRAYGIGLWLGYGLYGLTFPYHIITHSYYHLPLIPIVALSLAPLAAVALRPLTNLKPVALVRIALFGILFMGIIGKVWDVRSDLIGQDYKHEPAYWEGIAELLGNESSVVALTHDYGNRLAYYGWITPKIWLPKGHIEKYRELRGGSPIDVQEWFAEVTENRDYFLVTLMKQLEKQPELDELLYTNYAIFAEGDGFVIFDLHQPLQ
jgi:hypothetical protein